MLHFGQEYYELIPALPTDRVAGPDAVQEAGGHRLEQPVAARVSKLIGDMLEAIQIDEEQGGLFPVRPLQSGF
jgi:hypothetical protein